MMELKNPVYSGEEYEQEERARKRFLTAFFVSLGVTFAVCLGLLIWFMTMPYGDERGMIPKVIVMVLSSLFAFCWMAPFAIKYRRLRAYVKMLKGMREGLKSAYTEELARFETELEEHDGVDCRAMYTYAYSEAKDEYYEHKIFLDAEKPLPDAKEGDMLHFITYGSMLLAYEVIPRPQNEPATQVKFNSVQQKKVRDRTKTLWG